MAIISGKKACIIVAGGTGSRMGGNVPKQYLVLNKQPMIIHTIRRFVEAYPDIFLVLVVHPDFMKEMEGYLAEFLPQLQFKMVPGGETRFHSVKNGLAAVGEVESIAIHDAARPFVTTATIRRCFDALDACSAVVPVMEMRESVRRRIGEVNQMVPRQELVLVQTPQVFHAPVLLSAFEQGYRSEFTDDASVVEYAGIPIRLVQGNEENIKVTYPVDMLLAEQLVKQFENE